jgi:hypothetical protein
MKGNASQKQVESVLRGCNFFKSATHTVGMYPLEYTIPDFTYYLTSRDLLDSLDETSHVTHVSLQSLDDARTHV